MKKIHRPWDEIHIQDNSRIDNGMKNSKDPGYIFVATPTFLLWRIGGVPRRITVCVGVVYPLDGIPLPDMTVRGITR
jgi:hypothetical protein